MHSQHGANASDWAMSPALGAGASKIREWFLRATLWLKHHKDRQKRELAARPSQVIEPLAIGRGIERFLGHRGGKR